MEEIKQRYHQASGDSEAATKTSAKRSSSQETQQVRESAEPGMDLELKELYRPDSRYPWDDWCPDDMAADAEDPSVTAKYALIARRQKDTCGKGGLMLHSITIQSPLIRNFLRKVFGGYKGISTQLKNLTFQAPFHEFFYRWDRLQNLIAEEKDELALKHIELLQKTITPEIQPHVIMKDDLVSQGLVTYEYLWALFEPGGEVYSRVDDRDRLFTLERTQYDETCFILNCKYVDFDGGSFGYVSTSLVIYDFEGVVPIHELDVLPIDVHADRTCLYEELLRRGRTVEKTTGVQYNSYTGFYIPSRKLRLGPRRKFVSLSASPSIKH